MAEYYVGDGGRAYGAFVEYVGCILGDNGIYHGVIVPDNFRVIFKILRLGQACSTDGKMIEHTFLKPKSNTYHAYSAAEMRGLCLQLNRSVCLRI